MKVAAKLKRRLRGRENRGGLSGSYRHLLGVYVTSGSNLRHLNVAGEDLVEVLEDADAGDSVGRGVDCAGASVVGEPGLPTVVIRSTIWQNEWEAGRNGSLLIQDANHQDRMNM